MTGKPAGRFRLGVCLAVSLVLALAGCGSGGDEAAGEKRNATLVLDFIPGAIHAGIYQALANGYYEDSGISLKIVEPSATADTLKLVAANKADFGIADGVDLGTQIADGREVQGIMAITQRPSGGIITLAREGIVNPRQLAGDRVGVTGVPSDRAILDTIVDQAGGDPDQIERITLGFNGVQSLLAGKIKGFTGFIPADAVQIESRGIGTRNFALAGYGRPSYPGLVVFSAKSRIGNDPDLMQDFVDATTRGYREAIADPAAAIGALASRTPELDAKFAARSFEAWLPLLGPEESFGRFKTENLRELSRYLVDNGLAERPVAPARYATTDFTGRE